MISLLTELGKGATARWLTSLALPALIFIMVLTCAWLSRDGSSLGATDLGDTLTDAGNDLGATPGRLIVVGLGFLLATSAAGGLVRYLAEAVVKVWVASRPQRVVAARRRRAKNTDRTRNRKRPEAYLPATLTPIGDDFQLASARVRDRYETLDLTLVWPRLWLLISKDSREVITAAYATFLSAATFCAWSLMYIGVGLLSWPAALIGLAGLAAGHYRAKKASAALAILIESVVDINQKLLAEALGATLTNGQIGRQQADDINNQLFKRAFTPLGLPKG